MFRIRFFILIYLAASAGILFAAGEDTTAPEVTSEPDKDPFQGYLSFAWENDMYFQRDYYYTNGFQIDFFHKKLEASPFSRILLPPARKQAGGYYHGLQLRQEIFTPKDLSADTISAGDHPYSSTLTLTQVKVVNLPERAIRLTSGFQLGVLGPAALGFKTQELAHHISNPSRPPQGWDNQVKNDIIINYNFQFEKSFLQNKLSMFGIQGRSRLGTLHTDVSAGMWFRLDARSGYFQRLGPSGGKGFNFLMHFSANASHVFYDATLQGGMFNKSSSYFITDENMIRWLGQARVSATLELWEHQLVFYSHLSSPRFKNSSPLAWTGIAYKYWF
jgi:lipid A 3-O-deacylase